MPKQPPKIQRWIDLLAALLKRRFPVSFEELAREVPAYACADPGKSRSSVERMFERDKDELRAFGVPIVSVVSADGETHGYQLDKQEFYLPYLSIAAAAGGGRATEPRRVDAYGYRALKTLAFEPDELAVVSAAAARVQALDDPALAADARSAMRKLAFDLPAAALLASDDDVRVVSDDRLVDPALFEQLGDALLRRKGVTFDYQTMDTGAVARRSAEPYGLYFLSAHWYLAARDRDRSALRNFRVSRIRALTVNATRLGSPDYAVPDDFHLRAHAAGRTPWELGDTGALDAIVRFDRDTGATAAAATLGAPVEGAPHERRFTVRRLDAFARWLLSFGGDALPLSPPALVDEFQRVARAALDLYADTEAV